MIYVKELKEFLNNLNCENLELGVNFGKDKIRPQVQIYYATNMKIDDANKRLVLTSGTSDKETYKYFGTADRLKKFLNSHDELKYYSLHIKGQPTNPPAVKNIVYKLNCNIYGGDPENLIMIYSI